MDEDLTPAFCSTHGIEGKRGLVWAFVTRSLQLPPSEGVRSPWTVKREHLWCHGELTKQDNQKDE